MDLPQAIAPGSSTTSRRSQAREEIVSWEDYFKFDFENTKPEKTRTDLLVVTILMATSTFMAVLTPPGVHMTAGYTYTRVFHVLEPHHGDDKQLSDVLGFVRGNTCNSCLIRYCHGYNFSSGKHAQLSLCVFRRASYNDSLLLLLLEKILQKEWPWVQEKY
ncbi:hypothetical protein ACFE04_013224 [Oxalis oulophora]